MRKILLPISLLALVVFLLSGCTSQAPSTGQTTGHTSPTGSTPHFTLLKPEGAVPATCLVNPVYAGTLGKSGLEDVPWIRADPLSAHVTAFLFFVQPTYLHTHLYQPLHTGGGYADGRSTKILWILDAPQPPGEVTITGVKVSSPAETFHQTFPVAGSSTPGANYPSIVNVPTPGCWQIQFGTMASVLFWVIGK